MGASFYYLRRGSLFLQYFRCYCMVHHLWQYRENAQCRRLKKRVKLKCQKDSWSKKRSLLVVISNVFNKMAVHCFGFGTWHCDLPRCWFNNGGFRALQSNRQLVGSPIFCGGILVQESHQALIYSFLCPIFLCARLRRFWYFNAIFFGQMFMNGIESRFDIFKNLDDAGHSLSKKKAYHEIRQQESAQGGSGTPFKKRSNPTGESGALLAKWTMQIPSANWYAHSLHGSNATLPVTDNSLPGFPVACRKFPSAEAVLKVC